MEDTYRSIIRTKKEEYAKINNIENVKFFVGKAEEIITGEYENGNIRDIDVIVVDPPRKGLDKLAIDTMLKLSPKRIVYVSCDSSTLARDLKLLCEKEYELKKLNVVDQFARSYHVETVAFLSNNLKKKESYVTLDVEMADYFTASRANGRRLLTPASKPHNRIGV